MATKNLTAKDKFNALSNAKHIFSFKEEETAFKIVEIAENVDSLKAIVELESGEITGLFTNSRSAIESLKEVFATFEHNQPFVIARIRETAKGLSVYYCEVK